MICIAYSIRFNGFLFFQLCCFIAFLYNRFSHILLIIFSILFTKYRFHKYRKYMNCIANYFSAFCYNVDMIKFLAEADAMKIEGVPYQCVDWNKIKEERHEGESGEAIWRTFERGNVRARVVEYSAGYLANHWCPRGHVLFVLEGSVISELEDGGKEELRAGMGYVAEDDEKKRHRSFSPNGAKLFIVD